MEFVLLDIEIFAAVSKVNRSCQGRGQRSPRETSSQFRRRFALFRREGCDIDQGFYILTAVSRFANDCSTVGVANQNNGCFDAFDDARNRLGITGNATQWIGGGNDWIALFFQNLNHAIPTRRIRKSAVHENHRWLDVSRICQAGCSESGSDGQA
ncbi:hypothetical protein D3C84_927860 [compost metagenome]